MGARREGPQAASGVVYGMDINDDSRRRPRPISGTAMTPDEWKKRQAQAEELKALGCECVACKGTGGWPGLLSWIGCKVCWETGLALPTIASEELDPPPPER
jgi:hypothetical protein